MRYSAAAGFFPCQLFIEEKDFSSVSSQQLPGKCAGGSSSNYGDGKMLSHPVSTRCAIPTAISDVLSRNHPASENGRYFLRHPRWLAIAESKPSSGPGR